MKKSVSKVKMRTQMKCTKPDTDLILYAEGTLSSERISVVEAHLSVCPDCAEFLKSMKESLNSIEKEKVTHEDPYFFTRLMARKENRELKTPLSLKRFIPALVAATLFTGGVLTGINIGKLYPRVEFNQEEALIQERGYLDELDQESIESFFLTVNEGEDE